MSKNTWIIISLFMLAGSQASAKELNFEGFDYSGYLAGSYNYLSNSNKFTSGNYNRLNDLAPNGFTLQQATLSITKKPVRGFSGLVDMMVGRDAYGLAITGMNPNVFDNKNIGLIVPQAYLQYEQATIKAQAGLLISFSGYESYQYTDDTNFSRSILDQYAQPGSHLGLRALKMINNVWSLAGGIGNGWNTVERPAKQNAIELALNNEASSSLSWTLDVYSGNQYLTDSATNGPQGKRSLIDFFGTWKLAEKISISTNYDFGIQNKSALPTGAIAKAVWQGIAGYVDYQLNDKWHVTVRGELFEDPNGYRTGVRQNWREMTFTMGYPLFKELEIRAETRRDISNKKAFLAKNGVATSCYQQSFALSALLIF